MANFLSGSRSEARRLFSFAAFENPTEACFWKMASCTSVPTVVPVSGRTGMMIAVDEQKTNMLACHAWFYERAQLR